MVRLRASDRLTAGIRRGGSPGSSIAGPRHRRTQAAFSLVELTATLAIIGILAAFAIPRMSERTGFASRGAFDQAQALARYAQKLAIAQRRSPPATPIFVVVAATQIRVCYDIACANPVTDPASSAALVLDAPAGVAFAPSTAFSFDGSGSPSLAAQLAINVNSSGVGDVNRTFYVESGTGYVHD
ncbi:MAG TPA: type II secretion system protein [Burkholderiales bacterium]|nr:type II secretion system protein [Burkholderiales bacterium]